MVRQMGAKSDQVKGHAKEAAGILAGDKDLESEGKTDRRAGEAEEKIADAQDKVEQAIDTTKNKVEETVEKAKDALHRK
ncbi:MAG TPA: CsbD family protein [Actinomycetes bacterium]